MTTQAGRDRFVYHIMRREDWEAARAEPALRPESLESEGFVHASTATQLVPTWRRVFEGAPGLVALKVDSERLESPLRYEEGEPGELFPHIYGPVNRDAVVGIEELGEPTAGITP